MLRSWKLRVSAAVLAVALLGGQAPVAKAEYGCSPTDMHDGSWQPHSVITLISIAVILRGLIVVIKGFRGCKYGSGVDVRPWIHNWGTWCLIADILMLVAVHLLEGYENRGNLGARQTTTVLTLAIVADMIAVMCTWYNFSESDSVDKMEGWMRDSLATFGAVQIAVSWTVMSFILYYSQTSTFQGLAIAAAATAPFQAAVPWAFYHSNANASSGAGVMSGSAGLIGACGLAFFATALLHGPCHV